MQKYQQSFKTSIGKWTVFLRLKGILIKNVNSNLYHCSVMKSVPVPVVPIGSRKRKPSAPACSPTKDPKSAKTTTEEESEEGEVQIIWRDVPSRKILGLLSAKLKNNFQNYFET